MSHTDFTVLILIVLTFLPVVGAAALLRHSIWRERLADIRPDERLLAAIVGTDNGTEPLFRVPGASNAPLAG